MEDKQDVLVRTYATLSAIRKNIGEMTYEIPETYVNEYHAVLDKLEGIGVEVFEFRIPESEITPSVRSVNTLTGKRTYSAERYVKRPYLLTKLDAILGYFEIISSEKPRSIGFHRPNR